MTMRDNTRDAYDNPSTGAGAGAVGEQAANGREIAFTRDRRAVGPPAHPEQLFASPGRRC